MAEPSEPDELPGLVEAAPPELIAFRQTDYDVPFWARNNSYPARWNHAGDPPTQYWALHPDGAWAEFVRQEELTEEHEAQQIRRGLWVCRVPRGDLLDLRDPAVQEAEGVTTDDLTADDWGPCQALAERLRDRGCTGLLSPSAALPGCTNLTLFGGRRAIAWQRRPVLRSTVPSALLALGGPPAGIVGRVATPPPRRDDTLF